MIHYLLLAFALNFTDPTVICTGKNRTTGTSIQLVAIGQKNYLIRYDAAGNQNGQPQETQMNSDKFAVWAVPLGYTTDC